MTSSSVVDPSLPRGPRENPLKRVVRERVPEGFRGPIYRAFYGARRATSIVYSGDGHFCPCCARSFRRFRDWGPVANCRCPNCGSLPRQRLLMLFFQQRTDLCARDLRLLHLAPEPSLGRPLRRMANIDYVTADLNLPLADVRLDATDMPFADHHFDAVLGLHILEHIPDDRKAMSEIHRVLKPGGWAVLQVPIDLSRPETLEDPTITSPEDRLRVFGQEDHVRFYGADYVSRLRESGLDVTVDPFVRELSPALRKSMVLDDTEDIFFCRRLDAETT